MHWREDLDARIDHCPGCDQWRWDGTCNTCTKAAAAAADRHEVAEGTT